MHPCNTCPVIGMLQGGLGRSRQPADPGRTCLDEEGLIVGVGGDQGHQVRSGKVELASREESGPFLGVVVTQHALQVAQALWEGGGEQWHP